MQAVISGRAGVALLIDNNTMASIRADDIDGLIDQRTFATDSDER